MWIPKYQIKTKPNQNEPLNMPRDRPVYNRAQDAGKTRRNLKLEVSGLDG